MDKILALSMKNNQAVEINEHRFIAYCYLRQRKRTFKLNNILSIDIIRKRRKGA
jgi:predicted DNA-binding transcriptional regulator YafY